MLTVAELLACELCHACGAPAAQGGWFTAGQLRAFHDSENWVGARKLRVAGDPDEYAQRRCDPCKAWYCSDHWLFRLEIVGGLYAGIDAICPWGHLVYSVGPRECTDEAHDVAE
jgi:hypothetical protein